jgi:hypothetical protein
MALRLVGDTIIECERCRAFAGHGYLLNKNSHHD